MADPTRKAYKIVRAQLEHEDRLLGERLGWLIGAEAFLFVAYAAALTVSETPGEHRFLAAADRLFIVLPILGILLGCLVWTSVLAALWSIHTLRSVWLPEVSDWPPSRRNWPGRLGFAAPLLVPPSLVAAWAYLLLADWG